MGCYFVIVFASISVSPRNLPFNYVVDDDAVVVDLRHISLMFGQDWVM